jgi:GTPase Era involved in 16S rRNA processing
MSDSDEFELVRSNHSTDWHVEFANPLVRNAWNEPVVVRRSLGTVDREEAEGLAQQLMYLLEEEGLETEEGRSRVTEAYDGVVVDAAFADARDTTGPESRRSEVLPLPSASDGYTRVMFVGTTGAGKTTLLRNLIGSDHHTDKFPSTSTGRCTTANIEIITGRDDYQAAVTFLSENEVRGSIEECLMEAGKVAADGGSAGEIAESLLDSPDQTFRLKYVVGEWDETTNDDEGGGFFDGGLEESSETSELSEIEQQELQEKLEGFVGEIEGLADEAVAAVESDPEMELSDEVDATRREDFEEAFESHFRRPDRFATLVNDLLDEILLRFKWLEEHAGLSWDDKGWPTAWTYQTDDRETFLERLRWFSSNYKPRYGRLLTPVVEGMRVQGPFQSEFTGEERQVVFVDGRGLGHVASDAGSVSTEITSKFSEVDVILLVDNAEQPMQRNPLEAIRSVAVSGHSDKLGLAFTHFDNVTGDNLPTLEDRANHVLSAAKQALDDLSDEQNVSSVSVERLSDTLKERTFMLGWLDQAYSKIPRTRLVQREVRRMFDWFDSKESETDLVQSTPIYDFNELAEAVHEGQGEFINHWRGILGLDDDSPAEEEHWARIKALNRRIAEHRNNYEYDELKPLADLISRVVTSVSTFLEEPVEVQGYGVGEAKQEQAIESVRKSVHTQLHEMFKERIIMDPHDEWTEAFNFSGTGSTFERADKIEEIFEGGAPYYERAERPAVDMLPEELLEAVKSAVREGGGEFTDQD